MKIGDKIICKKACIMKDTGNKATTIGKRYTIKEIVDDSLIIIDDEGDRHFFGIYKTGSYYGNYFSTLKDNRKDKLKKIGEYEM